MSTFDCYIRTKNDLVEAVKRYGFVPFFRNEVEGFSIEERIAPEAWFPDEGEGIWEWKGPVIGETGCAYGKFFKKKAVFIDREFFPDFANYRRDGYDYDARVDEGIAYYREQELYSLVAQNEPVLSKELKFLGGYGKGKKGGFDTLINGLQDKCYVLIKDFVYAVDKRGKEYGWGIAEYATPERFFGDDFTRRVYERTPEESYERIFDHLVRLFPGADERKIASLLQRRDGKV